jgi:hypothetical protein
LKPGSVAKEFRIAPNDPFLVQEHMLAFDSAPTTMATGICSSEPVSGLTLGDCRAPRDGIDRSETSGAHPRPAAWSAFAFRVQRRASGPAKKSPAEAGKLSEPRTLALSALTSFATLLAALASRLLLLLAGLLLPAAALLSILPGLLAALVLTTLAAALTALLTTLVLILLISHFRLLQHGMIPVRKQRAIWLHRAAVICCSNSAARHRLPDSSAVRSDFPFR